MSFDARVAVLVATLATASPGLADPSPTEILDGYFDGMVAGKVAVAFDTLMTHSKVDEMKPREIGLAKGQIQQALALYGSPNGYEQISNTRYGTFLHHYVYLSRHKDTPLIWNFYFYDGDGTWQLLLFNFNDQVQQLH